MRGSNLWRLATVLALGLSTAVSAHGVIAFPPAQYVDRNAAAEAHSSGGGLRGAIPTQQVQAFSNGDAVSKLLARKKIAFDKVVSSSIKTLVDESIPDCGTSRLNIPPVDVSHESQFEWRNLGFDVPSQGPCEVWIDSKRAFEHQNCAKLFEVTPTIPFDYSACHGTCLLTLYWLFADIATNDTTPMKHCVPIRNGEDPAKSDSGSKSGSASKSANASGSGSSSSASSSGSGSEPSNCLFDIDDSQDLYTLSKFFDETYGSGHRTPAPKPVVRTRPVPSGPAISRWSRLRFVPPHRHHSGDLGYSATYTKSATEQCQYSPAGGYTCSSTETITDSVQPLLRGSFSPRFVHAASTNEPLYDLEHIQNLHEALFPY